MSLTIKQFLGAHELFPIIIFFHNNMDLIMSNKGQFPDNEPAPPSKISGLKFNNIIDLLPCSISIQNSELQIVLVNQNFKKNFGDATGKLCYTVYKGSNEICPSCPVKKSFRDKRMHISEETVQLLNGNRCQMLIQTSPIFDDYGEVAAVIDMATNISQIKTDQKELVTLGQSIALLSHGIKNILEGLEGGAYVVDEGLRDENLKLVKKGWNIVNKNIFDVTDFVKNILYSSKNRPLKYELTSPGQLVKDSLALFREKAAGLRIRLRQQINPYVMFVWTLPVFVGC